MKQWLRQVVLFFAALGASAVVSGAAFEQLERARVRRYLAPPGALVTLPDGRRLQVDCRGTGWPVVVLESGLDGYGSLSWASVHGDIAQVTRTCAYSRAGIMWSDPPRGPFDSRNAARDLHQALSAAGERAPWLMVGHSIGAAYVTTFAQLHGDEVGGVVLVDGSHPDQFARFREVTGRPMEPASGMARLGSALAWTGLVRMMPPPPSPASWPPVLYDAGQFFPTSLPALVGEMRAVPASLARAGELRGFGNRPLRVLTAARPLESAVLIAEGLSPAQGERLQSVSRRLHEGQAAAARCGRHVVVRDASHYIQFDRPDAVVDAIVEVVAMMRSGACARGAGRALAAAHR